MGLLMPVVFPVENHEIPSAAMERAAPRGIVGSYPFRGWDEREIALSLPSP
jgi:hypothetical protein